MSKRVLVLLAPGFEEIETVTPIDLLRRAEAEVVVASLTGAELVAGRSQITVQADASLEEVATESFDALVIPGGPGVKALRADGRAARLAREFTEAGKIVAAICAAPTVLQDAGLLGESRPTCHASVVPEIPTADTTQRVAQAGNLITSRGAGTALDFALALLTALYGKARSEEIAASIMA